MVNSAGLSGQGLMLNSEFHKIMHYFGSLTLVTMFLAIFLFNFQFFSGRHVVSAVEKFSPSSGTWCPVSPLLTPRRSHGVAMLDGALYAVGGSDGIATLNQV